MTLTRPTIQVIALFLFLAGLALYSSRNASLAIAQEAPTDQVLVELDPQFPGPNAVVSVKLTSYSGDLDRANIFWLVNGKTLKSGVGQKTFSFVMGAAGSPTTLNVVVNAPGIGTFNKSITLNPAQVDILWQALDSYTPPFYRGKALPILMSKIRLVAMPNMKTSQGASVKPSELVYKWTKDDDPMLDNSGFAKSFADFSLDFSSSDTTIEVNASSVKEAGLAAENTAYIPTASPKILFYEKKPLKGVDYDNALGDSFSLKNPEVEIVAEPYYLTSPNGRSYLSYNWLLNGAPAQTADKKSMILRVGDQKSGSSVVSLNVSQAYRFLQIADNSLRINFGQ